jgi:serpin B
MKYTFTAFLIMIFFAIPIQGVEPIGNKTDGKVVAKGGNEFATDLYGKLAKQEGNLFFSPFSVSTALGMTSLGAKNETLAQMIKTLHLPEDPVKIHGGFSALLGSLNNEKVDPKKRGYELNVANRLWGAKGAKWLPEYLTDSQKFYGAGLQELDFEKATEASRETINRWVEEKTKDKIKDLIPSGALMADTQLVLTNAIYFKGSWAEEFDKKLTKDLPFHVTSDKSIKVPMMYSVRDASYFEDSNAQVLQLPYRNGELSMILFLPKKKNDLAGLEKKFTSENVNKWLSQLRKEDDARITIPKFKMTSKFDLEKTLPEMGMKDLFSAGVADLSGMTGSKNLFISQVIHKAFVDVNEEGTEAAAATAIIARPTSAPIKPRTPPVFTADHPFLFVIRDNRSESILFMGRVSDPSAKSE